MMTKQYFSDSEWAVLLQAPTQAVLMILLADQGDPVFFLKEVQAAVQILASAVEQENATSDLLKSVIASLKQRMAEEPLQGDSLLLKQQFEWLATIQAFKSTSEGQKQAIAHLDQVKTILAAKVPIAQAEEFNQWILAIATQVAQVVKEGGLFSLGGEQISRQEAGGLSSIKKALNFK